jgi:translocation and assembly module TamB
VIEINGPEMQKIAQPEDSRDPFYNAILALSVEAPGRIYIRGKGLDSEWKGRLNIRGDTRAPVLDGSISLLRGRYNLFGKPLTLTRGTISFDGDIPPSPDFDVVGESKRSDVTTRVQLSGSVSEPTLRIESDPPMPSDEALSRLLFGKGMDEMSPFQALRLAQAIKALSGDGSGILDFFDRTQKLIGVDQLDIRQAGETSDQTALSVGKYIGEGIYVEVEKGLWSESDKVSIEADITPNISVESEAGTISGGGVGINWKFDY